MCIDCVRSVLGITEIDGIPVSVGDVVSQPLFRLKEDVAECHCALYEPWTTCSGDFFRFNPELPAEKVATLWVTKGWLPATVSELDRWEKRL